MSDEEAHPGTVPVLKAGALLLRPWVGDDAPALTVLTYDDPLMRWGGWPAEPPSTAEAAAAYLTELGRWQAGGSVLSWSVLDDGRLVGGVGLQLVPVGHASVGYWLAPEGRGRGLATEAVRLVSDYALSVLGLRRLRLFAHPDNMASQAVAMRCGYTLSEEAVPWADGSPRMRYVLNRQPEG